MWARGASTSNIFIILISPSEPDNMEQQVHKISCCKLSLRHNLLTLLFLYKTRNAIIISLSGIVGAACTAHSFVLKLLDHNA